MTTPIGLAAHGARVRHDLACLDIPAADWTPPRMHDGDPVHDVVIVGGGQSGLGAAFGLLRERISNVLVLDENPAGFEGPWATYARMMTLRTPKHLTAIDLGVPSLTFRAWWEAQHGAEGWAAIDRIARAHWMEYLRWYRAVLALPVRNDAKVTLVEPLPDQQLHRVHLADGTAVLARKVILATGIQGGGEWHVPPMIADALPQHLYAHTSQPIDFVRLRGKRIGILGGGASAFDNAQHALGQGVGEVHLFMRRAELPRTNPIRFMERAGLVPRFAALPDAAKYAAMATFFRHNQPPTNDMFARAAAWPNFALHLGSPWQAVEAIGEQVRVTTPNDMFDLDFVILSTGLVTDPVLRPELALVASRIARWSDHYVPPADLANPALDSHPYLGAGFQLQPRDAATDAALLHGLFAFNYSALISLGLSASALSGLKYALPRLCAAVADQIFIDNSDYIMADFHSYDEAEFIGTWPVIENHSRDHL